MLFVDYSMDRVKPAIKGPDESYKIERGIVVKDKVINEWLDELGTKEGKYGGGSAASMVGAIAARLAQYVYEFQIEKKDFSEHRVEIEAGILRAKKLSDELLNLAEVDADIFTPVMELFKLPKDTEEERVYRREQLDKGFAEAAQPPLDIMKKMDEAMDLFEELLDLKVRGSILDDVAVGLLLTDATIRSEKVNCETNIRLIHDEETRDALEKEAVEVYERLVDRAEKLQERTRQVKEENQS